MRKDYALDDGSAGGRDDAYYTVPDGKRLVIETVSVSSNLPTGQGLAVDISILENGTRVAIIAVPTVKTAENAIRSWNAGTESLRVYAEPQATVEVGYLRDLAQGSGSMQVTLSGQLIPKE